MTGDARRMARECVIAQMRRGQPWRVASKAAGLNVPRATAYRLLRKARLGGEADRRDGRQGHASKMRAPVRAWLATYCRGAPHQTSRHIQVALRDRFGLTVSVSQINRVRAALGLSRRRGAGGKCGDQPVA